MDKTDYQMALDFYDILDTCVLILKCIVVEMVEYRCLEVLVIY